MVTVRYLYRTKAGEVRSGESSFWDPYKAKRFMFRVKRSPDMFLESWSCDREEEECLWPF